MVEEGGRQGGAATFQVFTSHILVDPGLPVSEDVVVGVVDTGVVVLNGAPHDFIAANLTDNWSVNQDVLPAAGEPLGRYDGHGTFVAGLIKNEAPTVRIDVRRALDWSPGGAEENDQKVADCIRDLAEVPNLRIINLSFFGSSDQEHQEPPEIRRALDELFRYNHDIVVVTAAANRWTDDKHWPAGFSEDFEQVIAVGAVDETVTPVPGLLPPRASFSSLWGGIDVFTSGCGIVGPTVQRTDEVQLEAFSHGLRKWADIYARDIGAIARNVQPIETDTFTFSMWSGASFAAAKVTGLLAQAMIEDGLSGAAARNKVINESLPRIPLPGQTHGTPYIPGT